MILKKIVENKKIQLARRKESVPVSVMESLLSGLPRPRPLIPALRRPDGEVAVIAEIKRASPSKGILCENFNPAEMAREYERGGAAAVSVLTEENFFLGHHSHLYFARKATVLPILRKDFVIDSYQLYESRVLGADAVLLIAAVLTERRLRKLMNLAGELGMSCLVEIHTGEELEQALGAGAKIIGINNRDLNTFATDLNRTFALAGLIDRQKVVVVSESGIKSCEDISRLRDMGVHAVLVGEALVRRESPGEILRKFVDPAGRRLEGGAGDGGL
ncbi:MAG TPA: indole-3-glycerol phosphate synthase TrpC [Bacillota bacterium]|nr:indole-3-glycerol phosphate synthase TrpC [Bacillota bacterium]